MFAQPNCGDWRTLGNARARALVRHPGQRTCKACHHADTDANELLGSRGPTVARCVSRHAWQQGRRLACPSR